MNREDFGRQALAALGVDVLAGLIERTQHAVVICGPDRTYVYANPAACELMGEQFDELVGQDFLRSFPAREHAGMLAHFATQLEGGRDWRISTICRPDGTEREVSWSAFALEIRGVAHAVATITDTTDTRRAARVAATLAHTAAEATSGAPTRRILSAIGQAAVEESRATACGIAVVGQDGRVDTGGYPLPPEFGDLVAGSLRLEDIPGYDVFSQGRTVVLPDARERWRANPVTAPVEAAFGEGDWVGGVYVPMTWRGRLFGVLGMYLPAAMTTPSETELAFWSALADQASVAVMSEQLRLSTEQNATLLERQRLARELHDSISQALFSMTLHARSAERRMAEIGLPADHPALCEVQRLVTLTQGALAEMRALIFELRPGALVEEGFVAALLKQATALSAREAVRVSVVPPAGRPQLPAKTEEQVYRIVLEALHNTVKHANATEANVRIDCQDDEVRVSITDDGIGFDQTAARPGHFGLQTMAERAAAAGARLDIRSSPGAGTAITLRVPLGAGG